MYGENADEIFGRYQYNRLLLLTIQILLYSESAQEFIINQRSGNYNSMTIIRDESFLLMNILHHSSPTLFLLARLWECKIYRFG